LWTMIGCRSVWPDSRCRLRRRRLRFTRRVHVVVVEPDHDRDHLDSTPAASISPKPDSRSLRLMRIESRTAARRRHASPRRQPLGDLPASCRNDETASAGVYSHAQASARRRHGQWQCESVKISSSDPAKSILRRSAQDLRGAARTGLHRTHSLRFHPAKEIMRALAEDEFNPSPPVE